MKIHHGVVLAGGQSTRMGRDKALLPVGGMAMLERVVRVIEKAGLEVIVVGRKKPVAWPGDLPASFLPDADLDGLMDKPGGSRGPIVGLIAALEALRAPVLVVGCDMPLLTAELLGELLTAHAAGSGNLATLAVTLDEGNLRPEPLLAVYEPGILPLLRNMLAAGRRSLQALLGCEGVNEWRVPAERKGDLVNVNAPADLQHAETRLREREIPPAPPTPPQS